MTARRRRPGDPPPERIAAPWCIGDDDNVLQRLHPDSGGSFADVRRDERGRWTWNVYRCALLTSNGAQVAGVARDAECARDAVDRVLRGQGWRLPEDDPATPESVAELLRLAEMLP